MGRVGEKTHVAPKYALGTAEEVANRDKTGYQPSPTAFQQIGPNDRGGNANEPSMTSKSGDLKFADKP